MSFEKCIQESIKIYMSTHSRSNKKLIPIHSFINKSIKKYLNTKYKVFSLPDKEIVVNGRYNPKKVDVCIKKVNKIVGTGSIKFIMGNYQQNANNYFENCTGELVNLYKTSNTLFVMIIFDEIPYYDSNHNIKNYHKMDKKDFIKYNKLIIDGYLNNLIIVKVSNGKFLQHPSNISNDDLSTIDFTQFKILESYPDTFDNIIRQFSKNCTKQ